jgi:methylmalonyl-CoA mutase
MAYPGEFPFIRGNRTDGNRWCIRQDIMTESVEEANRFAKNAIGRGADALGFRVKEIDSHRLMNNLLDGIDILETAIHFTASRSYPLTLELFLYEISHRDLDGKKIHGSLNFDPVSFLLLHGDFYVSWENNMDEAEYLVNTVLKRLPSFRAITVNGHLFGDSGATIVQELAFSLASACEYLAALTGKGFSVDRLTPLIQFGFGTESEYFPEIAKLRAARLLWSTLVNQFHPQTKETARMFIHAVTSGWNKTIYDPYVNILRTTAEGMAAAIGNADSLEIRPFDAVYEDPGEFSSRVARNQQLILREEAYLDQVADPGAGSYFIEILTDSIASHAWELFKQVEGKGGMLECIRTGFIQEEIEKSREKKMSDMALRKTVAIGINQYPNPEESLPGCPGIPEETDSSSPETKYRTIRPYRKSAAFEKLRMETDRFVSDGNKRPSVFLLTMGNLAMRKARAMFTANFFGCAGYTLVDNPGFSSVEEGIKAAAGSGAEIVVICSSDEEYATIAQPLAEGIKKEKPSVIVMVAGHPAGLVETLKAAGVDDFIHVRSNLLETLQNYQGLLINR